MPAKSTLVKASASQRRRRVKLMLVKVDAAYQSIPVKVDAGQG